MNLPIEILFGLIAMVGYGLSNAIAQVPSKEIGSRKTIFYRNIFVSILLLAVLLPFLKETVFSPKYILITLAIAFIGYFSLMAFYKALKVGKVGIVSPLANSSVIFTVLLSIIFFGEILSTIQFLAIALIILGIILVSLNFKDLKNSHLFKISSGIPYALLTCFIWGLVFFLFKIPVNVIGPILTSLTLEFGIMIYSGIHIHFSKLNFSLPNKKILLPIFLVAFFGAIGTLFFTLGIKNYSVSLVAAITFANPLVATLYGKIVYKEKLHLQQYFAIALMILGIVLISYY